MKTKATVNGAARLRTFRKRFGKLARKAIAVLGAEETHRIPTCNLVVENYPFELNLHGVTFEFELGAKSET